MLENRKIYVTMTTLPKRDVEVGQCLNSIFAQTYKNIEVIMYLNDWEYPDHKLPDSIANVSDERFRIVWLTHDDYKGDLRAWKSVIPFLKEHVHENNILWYQSDDDWVYYPEMLQDLVTSLGDDKYAIATNSGFVTIFGSNILYNIEVFHDKMIYDLIENINAEKLLSNEMSYAFDYVLKYYFYYKQVKIHTNSTIDLLKNLGEESVLFGDKCNFKVNGIDSISYNIDYHGKDYLSQYTQEFRNSCKRTLGLPDSYEIPITDKRNRFFFNNPHQSHATDYKHVVERLAKKKYESETIHISIFAKSDRLTEFTNCVKSINAQTYENIMLHVYVSDVDENIDKIRTVLIDNYTNTFEVNITTDLGTFTNYVAFLNKYLTSNVNFYPANDDTIFDKYYFANLHAATAKMYYPANEFIATSNIITNYTCLFNTAMFNTATFKNILTTITPDVVKTVQNDINLVLYAYLHSKFAKCKCINTTTMPRSNSNDGSEHIAVTTIENTVITFKYRNNERKKAVKALLNLQFDIVFFAEDYSLVYAMTENI